MTPPVRAIGRRQTSIRARMTAAFAVFIAALMFLVCAAFWFSTRADEHHAADALLSQTRLEIERELAHGEHSLSNPGEFFSEENDDLRAMNVAILIIGTNGLVEAQSGKIVPPWPARGDSWRTISFRAGRKIVVLGLPWAPVERQLRARTLLLLALSALVVAISSLGAWFLVGRTLSPLDGLARQANESSVENLRVELQSPSQDAEMLRLVATLNDLLARLAQTTLSRGRFYAAASHELRTPLQGLAGLLEVALSRPRENAEYVEVLAQSRAQTERLTALVQDLLLLNQLEMESARPRSAHSAAVWLDLADIGEAELEQLRPLISQKRLLIDAFWPPTCELSAPWTHATMLFRNLLENAVKYARDGGQVCVRVSPARLEVWNECDTPPDFDTEPLFEPFFRLDAARTGNGGNGLGLSICRAICVTNGWRIALQGENGGLSATVDFENQNAE